MTIDAETRIRHITENMQAATASRALYLQRAEQCLHTGERGLAMWQRMARRCERFIDAQDYRRADLIRQHTGVLPVLARSYRDVS